MLNILVKYTDITTPSVHKIGKKPVHVGLYQSVTGLFVTGFDRFLAVFIGHSHGFLIWNISVTGYGHGHAKKWQKTGLDRTLKH